MIFRSHISRIILIIAAALITFECYAQGDADIILKARAYSNSGRTSQAISLLSQAIGVSPTSRLYLERGEACLAGKDLSGAIRDFNEANRIDDHSGDYGLARIYALKGDASTSLHHLELNLKSAYKIREKEIMLEPSFKSLENRPEWRQFWKKEWYSSAERTVSEIEYLAASNKVEEAKSLLSELQKNYPDSDEALYGEAIIELAAGKYNEAVLAATRLTGTNQGNEKYMRVLARAQTGQSNPSGASVTYTRMLDSGVADAQLLILRAECYRKTKENERAMKDIVRYLDLYPENKDALSLAGKVEAESGDNLKALEYFSKNLKLHPNDPDCYVDRANSYFASKTWEWAARDYSMSLDLKPGNPDAWLNKGIALLGMGNINDACHDFRRSYALGNQKATPYISKNCLNR